MTTIWETDLPLSGRRAGKVRDIYDLPPGPDRSPRLLIVASDRLSAFDVVLPTPIPGKGRLLTAVSIAWFAFIERQGLSAHHLLSTDPSDIPGLTDAQRASLEGRIMITRRCEVVPVECVARGYLEGSGWREYRETGGVCGVELPPGLQQADRLPEPIFTPATKAEQGEHDQNITFEQACGIAGDQVMWDLRARTMEIYNAAHQYARERGVILADTKFEFGFPVDATGARTGEPPILIDEVLTPDSSRYWPADHWQPGREQTSFDKQFVREHLQRLTDAGDWNKKAPGPELPEDVVAGTIAKYEDARERLFGSA